MTIGESTRGALSRRGFLQRSAAAGGYAAAIAITSTGALLNIGEAWGLEVKGLKPETMRTLILVARDIYPHDRVPDRNYAIAVKSYDEKAAADPATKAEIEAFVAALDGAAGPGGYVGQGWEADRVALLKGQAHNPMFETIRSGLVVSLYNQQEIWPIFGYEGEVLLEGRLYRARLQRHHLALTSPAKPESGEETDMAAKFDLNDDSVVVIVGSGAGGGTLGNELAQKGVKVVVIEAGKRYDFPDFINDEWASFAQLAWTDMRTTSGSWRVHKNFPNLPAWIVKSVGGTTTHWAGASLRLQDHEFKTASTYGTVPGANLLDWPLTLAELEPYYAKAEAKMRVTRTGDLPGLPGNNNFKVFKAGADKLGYKECHTGRMAINSVPGDGRVACHQTGFCFQGCKWGAKWSTLYTEIPKGEATGNMEVRPEFACRADRARRFGEGDRRDLLRRGGQTAAAEGADRGGRRQLAREPAASAEFRVGEISRRPRQFLGPGRPQLHAPHDWIGLCDLRQTGSHVSWDDHGRHHPRRSAQQFEPRVRRRV